jgi:hypothetical protein
VVVRLLMRMRMLVLMMLMLMLLVVALLHWRVAVSMMVLLLLVMVMVMTLLNVRVDRRVVPMMVHADACLGTLVLREDPLVLDPEFLHARIRLTEREQTKSNVRPGTNRRVFKSCEAKATKLARPSGTNTH